ncbi:MAG: hypothetical protein KGS61_01380 [Verrucomicrobia bacterium]|nr:hypothetical protein [Verrucomicrobiota bacterium]
MNVDEILDALNREQVEYPLIGGMNFLLRHRPELTFDVDVWVRDDSTNLPRLNRALRALGAEWGETEMDWKPVPEDWRWLLHQGLFCLTTRHGALDSFREVCSASRKSLKREGDSLTLAWEAEGRSPRGA